jgi:enoyl-CoA hydratase
MPPGSPLWGRLSLALAAIATRHQHHRVIPARRLSMTGEVIDAARAKTMGLVTEVVAHGRLLDRTVELATQVCEVAAPTMQSLKAIYVAGAAAIIDPALAAEQTFAKSVAGRTDGLGERYREVAERNRRQIRRPG